MQAKQMRDMPDHELSEQVADLRKELLDLRLSNSTGELDDTARLPRTRRDLARALTVARERELEAQQRGRA
jgi:large subunit ribosomal protein L29